MHCGQQYSVPQLHCQLEVWAYNLEHEFENMLRIVEKKKCSYIAMDTEFPGIVITNSASPSLAASAPPAWQLQSVSIKDTIE